MDRPAPMKMRRWATVLLFLAAGLFVPFAPVRAQVSAPSQDGSFSAVWWNIENFGATDRIVDGQRVESAMKPQSEIDAVIAILKQLNPDILGVTEVVRTPDDRYLKLLQTLLSQQGLDYPYFSTAHGEDPRIQAVLFSRFPIKSEAPFTDDAFAVTLVSPSTGEKMAGRFRVGRGFVNAEVELAPGVPLQIMLAHLKSKRAEPGVAEEEPGEGGDETVRAREARLLRRHIDDFVRDHPGADLLVMGDMNDTPNSKALRPLLGSEQNPSPVRDLPLTDRFGDWWTEYFEPPKSYDRIDYIFATPSLYRRFLPKESYLYRPNEEDAAQYDTYSASDHRPLLARFSAPLIAPK